MRAIRTSGSEGGGNELNHFSLPLSRPAASDLRFFGNAVGTFSETGGCRTACFVLFQ